MSYLPLLCECHLLMGRTDERYGPFTSTHEALGVITEEFYELVSAIRSNALDSVRHEAIDLAAAALRLAEACQGESGFTARSKK